MKLRFIIGAFALMIFITACSPNKKKQPEGDEKTEIVKDEIIYSFALMGCNRIDWNDVSDSIPSTANKGVLKRILAEMTSAKRKPDMFFFLGDLVLAESTLAKLDTQLSAWVDLYENDPFSKSGIEMIAVPGNHEMLYSKETKDKEGNKKYEEYPLKGSAEIWLKYMADYMPTNRNQIGGSDSLANQMTFSFKRNNIAFIVMNTDTYNSPTATDPYGREGLVPVDWVTSELANYKNDKEVKHIFVLGHRPYYINNQPVTGHRGLPQGPELWPAFRENKVVAYLSAHLHDYQRMQPEGNGTYQLIAGNGGSKGSATFFGYSTINIYQSGRLELISTGFDVGSPYYVLDKEAKSTVRDSTTFTWTKDSNPYQ